MASSGRVGGSTQGKVASSGNIGSVETARRQSQKSQQKPAT